MKTLYSYPFEGTDGIIKMHDVMKMFRYGFKSIGGFKVESILGQSKSSGEDPLSGDVEYRLARGSIVVIKPHGTEPKLEVSISVADSAAVGGNEKASGAAADTEESIRKDMENIIYMDYRAGYCCE